MIEICAIASGSNGNCYYIGNSEDAVLIDAGISCKQVMARMAARNLNPGKVKAVFVTHEHIDHYSGIRVFGNKTGIPVYMTSKTCNRIKETDRPADVREFVPGDAITIGGFTIHAFLKNHDAAEPCSFRVEHEGVSVGVFTDIGRPCVNVFSHLAQCHALFLECNYDAEMLWSGPYPYHLKSRIASGYGHLSNNQALELLKKHHHPALEIVFLSHLSAENNSPEIAASVFDGLKDRFRVEVTDRYAASEVYSVKG